MSTVIHPEQSELIPSVITRLNETRGVVDTSQLPEFKHKPETRQNIAGLAGIIGVALAEVPRDTSDPHDPNDQPLGLAKGDFRRAGLKALSHGLYIQRDDPRYRDAKNLRIAILATLPLTIFGQNGVQPPHVGVALGKGEYTKMVPHPGPLAARARAVTLDAWSDNMNREDSKEAGFRASGHALENKLLGLEKLDRRFVGQYALLLSMYRDARIVWRTAYLGKNLNRNRKEADELIHEVVETAANSLNYDTPKINATHRAVASNLYRRGSAAELAESWRSVTEWAALYIAAKRGKVNQSQNGCRRQLHHYQPHLDKPKVAKAAA